MALNRGSEPPKETGTRKTANGGCDMANKLGFRGASEARGWGSLLRFSGKVVSGELDDRKAGRGFDSLKLVENWSCRNRGSSTNR